MSDEDYTRYFRLMGETIIIRALSNVNYMITNSHNYIRKEKRKKCLEDLHFINNGGLDTIIELFQLDLDADTLHQAFYYKIRQR